MFKKTKVTEIGKRERERERMVVRWSDIYEAPYLMRFLVA